MNPMQGLKRFMRSRVGFLLACGILAVACKDVNFSNEDSFGLRLVTIQITPEEYGLLAGQLLSKRPAQAEIRVAGEFKVQCSASYAGRSSLD